MPWDAQALPIDALAKTELLMRELARGPVADPLGEIAVEALDTGGKRLRARLALAAAGALGVQQDRAVGIAAAVELIHNASLIHDDLQDGDEVRRGLPTVWKRHGAAHAISAGDLMLMIPFAAVDHIDASGEIRFGIARRMASAVAEMARGQAFELELPRELAAGGGIGPYLRCVEGKTGALFEAPVHAAALLAGHDEAYAAELALPFRRLGVLFQMQDDLLDLWGDKGREQPGNDIREGKVSYLVALHLERVPEDREWLLEILARPREETSDADVQSVIDAFVAGGTRAAALAEICARARAVETAPALRAHPGLVDLVRIATRRTLQPIAHLLEPGDAPLVSAPLREATA